MQTLSFSKKIALTFLAGLLSALALAPLFWWPVLFITMSVFYVLTAQTKSIKDRTILGWFFGFGYFTAGLFWIGNALLVENNPYLWVWPLAVLGLPAILAFFPAVAMALTRFSPSLKTISGFLFFCASLGLSEYLRGHLFTGFPWNLYGYIWGKTLSIAQIIFHSDIYFLSLLTILWASLGGFLFVSQKTKKRWIFAILILLSMGSTYFYGQQRLSNMEHKFLNNISISVIQPNIPQHEKWDTSKMGEHFTRYLQMSMPKELPPPENKNRKHLIIWPETALNYWFLNDTYSMQAIAQVLQSYEHEDAYLLTGALRRDYTQNTYANSLVEINDKGELNNIYDKHHLVPFGEYIPFQKWIPLDPITKFSGFVAGKGPKYFSIPNGPSYSPQICYESIFSGEVTDNKETKRPDFLLNVTNDAWYGNSPGPYQHLTQAKFRAIEEGIPMIRAANTGISAIINPYGQIEEKIELSSQEKIILFLPEYISPKAPLLRGKYLLSLIFILLFMSNGVYILLYNNSEN